MDGQTRGLDRRSLVSGMVAALILGIVWLLPSAYSEADDAASTSPVIPLDQPLDPGSR
ncbi:MULTISPECIES: hypothetical protein [Streptomyces]|uniref:hypothetical protein n=1 Tax=Streptomyces TaxID=1883 RepID=UPI00186B25DD|nr:MULTISPECIES: hypothetical protein [Streptomyces]